MLATNGYDDDDYQQLLKEFEERRAEKKAQKIRINSNRKDRAI